MWGVVLWSARSETFSREGFSLFQLDTKKNSNRTHNTTRTQGVVKNTRRGLSPFCKRKPSATTKHVVQSVKDEDVHAKSYYGVLSKDIEKNQIQKKTFYIICLGFVNVALSFGVFLCVSTYVSPEGLHSFRVPPFFDPDVSRRRVHKADSRVPLSGKGEEMYI